MIPREELVLGEMYFIRDDEAREMVAEWDVRSIGDCFVEDFFDTYGGRRRYEDLITIIHMPRPDEDEPNFVNGTYYWVCVDEDDQQPSVACWDGNAGIFVVLSSSVVGVYTSAWKVDELADVLGEIRLPKVIQ